MDGEQQDSEGRQPECPGCRALRKEVAELQRTIAQLQRTIEELRRAGKRQAGPFSKGPPKPKPKRPGRKPGDDYGTHFSRSEPECQGASVGSNDDLARRGSHRASPRPRP